MKKLSVLTVVPLIFGIFACTLPSNVEIMGTPELSFKANKNLTDMFADMIGMPEYEGKSVDRVSCKNTEYQTYIIHMELYNKKLDIDLDIPGGVLNGQSFALLGGKKIRLADDVEVLETAKSVSFGGGLDKFLNGFEFSGVKSTIFVSGSKIVDCTKLDLKIDGLANPDSADGKYEIPLKDKPSGFKDWGNEYPGKTMPEGRGLFNLSSFVMSGKEIILNFKVILKGGEEIDLDWLDSPITVEFIIWYPLQFTATSDNAKIDFPDDFFGDGDSDLFGRSEPNSKSDSEDEENSLTDIIQSLELVIKLNHNLFDGAKLNIKSKKVTISTDELKNQSIGFKIDENTMKEINDPDNYPFSPKFSFNFKKGGKFSIPWELIVEEFSFKARIRYNISISGEDK